MIELGLVGGYFFPIHNWHLLVGDAARHQYGLSKVLYIPSGTPPHKQSNPRDRELRYALTAAAVRSNPCFEASRIEIDRDGVTWTLDTLKQLKAQYGDGVRLNFIMGEDNIKSFQSYEHSAEFFSLCRLLIAPRGTADAERIALWQSRLPGAEIGVIDCPASGLSSTIIRDLIAKGLPYRYLVPEPVYEMIERYKLFTSEQRYPRYRLRLLIRTPFIQRVLRALGV